MNNNDATQSIKAKDCTMATFSQSTVDGYVRFLTWVVWRSHYKEGSSDFEFMTDTIGVLTQLDNMLTGWKSDQLPAASEAQYLNEVDMASLLRFDECCEDSDADGHDVSKADMKRLSEIGVVRHVGFGRHEMTTFGRYVVERHFEQAVTMPLLTYQEECDRAAIQSTKEPI